MECALLPPSSFISFLPPYLLPSLSPCDPRTLSASSQFWRTSFFLSVFLSCFQPKTERNNWNVISSNRSTPPICYLLSFPTCFLTHKHIFQAMTYKEGEKSHIFLSQHAHLSSPFPVKLLIGLFYNMSDSLCVWCIACCQVRKDFAALLF